VFPVAVLAGGLGTRMAAVTMVVIPNALLTVACRPFIDYKLGEIAAQGVETVVLLVGHGDDRLSEHVGSGARYGLRVTCRSDGAVLLGTGGAIRQALDELGDAFWVTYGDSYLRAPMAAVEEAFLEGRFEGMMTVLRNRDRWDRSNVRVEHGLVVEYRKGASAGTYEDIEYGLSILRRRPFERFPPGRPFDLQEVFQQLVRARQMGAYSVGRRFYEIGSPEGYRETDTFLRSSNEWERLRVPGAGDRSRG
jgi:N-acetyl-alpha-D-muramate 1-phosphate uridylyltransferase